MNVTVVPELTSPAQPGTDQQVVGDPPEIDDELPAEDNFALRDAAARTRTHLTSWHLEPQSATAMKDAIQACPMASVQGRAGNMILIGCNAYGETTDNNFWNKGCPIPNISGSKL